MNLRRITGSKRFIPEIDGLRFAAILSVVWFHFYSDTVHHGVPDTLAAQLLAKRGVYLFFAISGFILALPFARARTGISQPVSLRTYFFRRLTRLEPPYVLSLLIYAGALLATGSIHLRTMLPHLLASILYLHNFLYHNQGPNPINGVTWSLEVEVQFYLLVPLLSGVFFLRKQILRRLLLLGTTAVVAILTNTLSTIILRVVYFLPYFLAGFLAADFYLEHAAEWRLKRSFFGDLPGAAFLAAIWLVPEPAEHIALPFVLIGLFVAVFRGRILHTILSARWITDTGGMCYTIYLYHDLVIWGVRRLTAPLHIGQSTWPQILLHAAIALPFVWLVCAALFLVVERPCMEPAWPSALLNMLRRTRNAGILLEPDQETGQLDLRKL